MLKVNLALQNVEFLQTSY